MNVFLSVVVVCLTWVIWLMSIGIPFLAGRQHPKAWVFALWKQVLWAITIIITDYWYIVPLWIGLTSIYTYNYLRWKKNPPSRSSTTFL